MSNLRFKARISSRDDAIAFLGPRDRRELAYATHVFRDRVMDIVGITHHGSVIAVFPANAGYRGVVRLSIAGWNSATTTRRLHMILRAVMDRVDPLDRDRAAGYLVNYGIGITGGLAVLREWSDNPGAPRRVETVIGDGTVVIDYDGRVRVEGNPL